MTVPKNMQTDTTITEASEGRFKIRRVEAADIPQLVPEAKEMFLSAFSEAYKEVSYFGDYVEEAFTNEQFLKEIAEPNTEFWIVLEKNVIAGYAKLKTDALPPDTKEGKGFEIKRFYLHQAYHGTGLAQYFMSHCLELARKKNCDIVWLGVWPRNHKAIKFYKKYNFEIAGEVPFRLGDVVEWDWVMKKSLPMT